jgi:hypothetical protein
MGLFLAILHSKRYYSYLVQIHCLPKTCSFSDIVIGRTYHCRMLEKIFLLLLRSNAKCFKIDPDIPTSTRPWKLKGGGQFVLSKHIKPSFKMQKRYYLLLEQWAKTFRSTSRCLIYIASSLILRFTGDKLHLRGIRMQRLQNASKQGCLSTQVV